jgi:hypothetical protein
MSMSFNFLTYAMLLANPQMPIKFSLHPPNIYVRINPLGTIVLMVLPLSFYRFFKLGDHPSQALVKLKV